jgi:hypothetical protein
MTDPGTITRCAVCDGYGWIAQEHDPFDDLFAQAEDASVECRWCGGIGYVTQDARGIARRIPEEDLPTLADRLEEMEAERLRAIGYTGTAKAPHQQAIRLARGDSIAQPPHSDEQG